MYALKALKAEADRKRKALADKGLQAKKYVKRSELERVCTQPKPEEVKEPSPGTPERGEGSKGGATLMSPTALTSMEGSAALFSIPMVEVIRRLRERDEPIRLFGETDKDVSLRLRQIEILAPEVNKGLTNDFKDALDKLDQENLLQLARQDGDEGGERLDLQFKDDGTTLEDLLSLMQDLEGEDEDKQQDVCLRTLKFLLKEWAKELNSRPVQVKSSVKGKLESVTFKQTEGYLKPLFKQMKKKRTLPDILRFLALICSHLLNREYVKANDAYLSMAIGNAPWPIGVTMVGIHARTGREKIFSQQIAHVLNDETQRKYIQAVKRLMTFCQHHFPTDPSKCVEFSRTKSDCS